MQSTPASSVNEEKPLSSLNRTDHTVSHRHRLSLRSYPRDCPPIRPCWFHAVDVPKRRPLSIADNKAEAKPAAKPKKYAAFSVRDSKAIEAAFQKLVEEEEAHEQLHFDGSRRDDKRQPSQGAAESDKRPPTKDIHVPVNEDYLFDVNVEQRELAPAYWLGPVYDVRRGTWFYQDGSVQRPCDENLAAQLEEGYLKIRAWTLKTSSSVSSREQSTTRSSSRPTSWAPDEDTVRKLSVLDPKVAPNEASKRNSTSALVSETTAETASDVPTNSYRLFGAHMNSVVTFQDANTAWLMTDDFLSRMNYTMYQRFAGGGHFAGVKLTRGFVDADKKKAGTDSGELSANEDEIKTSADGKKAAVSEGAPLSQPVSPSTETRRQTLARQMSALIEDVHENPEKQEKERQRRDEREIKNDYRETEGDEQGREIEHLILVTHGIGQRLGLRLESVNFVHDVNSFRKTLKSVYSDSPDLRALNAELGNMATVNSRIQVLPICWRHLLDFPKRSIKQKRKEHDIVDSDIDDAELPSLDDITVEGVPAVRNLVTDLALDILLYQSAVYKDHISRIVLSECNRIYRLFKERNPKFNGRVSLVGHSLGSAIMFDILCKQDSKPDHVKKAPSRHHHDDHNDLRLDFEVADFYALGSPIGLFQMLNGQTIAARRQPGARAHYTGSMDDPMLGDPLSSLGRKNTARKSQPELSSDIAVSRPKCLQVFNIFHPTDPIAYRIEPMISSAMASLKPQPLPYTKRGIFGGPVGQGLSGIGNRVTQSVSSMWSSVASNLLTRGLGYAGDSSGKSSNHQSKSNVPLSFKGEASASMSASSDARAKSLARQEGKGPATSQLHDSTAFNNDVQHPPTLIDNELETLCDGLEKQSSSLPNSETHSTSGGKVVEGSAEWLEAEERVKRLRREEQKVRLLNSNGRVDYSIQEGAFDINLIAAVASHLSYWTDEDVSHFVISQILSRYRST